MISKFSGEAIIENSETGENIVVLPSELVFDQYSDPDRQMGVEIVYVASFDYGSFGTITWNLSEYPVGVENHKWEETSGHKILKNFEYGLEHEEEPEHPYSHLSELAFQDQIDAVVGWFKTYFEDPANQTPYESREGGYLYIWGGPYNASDEMYSEFGEFVDDDVIKAAVEEVEHESFEWAPSDAHPDMHQADLDALRARFEGADPASLSIDDLLELAVVRETNAFGSRHELEKRDEFTRALNKLVESLKTEKTHAGIGHNNPPDEFDLGAEALSELEANVEELQSALSKANPDLSKVAPPLARVNSVGKYFASKADKFFDAYISEVGKEAGKWTVRLGIGIPLAGVLVAAKEWLLALLGV